MPAEVAATLFRRGVRQGQLRQLRQLPEDIPHGGLLGAAGAGAGDDTAGEREVQSRAYRGYPARQRDGGGVELQAQGAGELRRGVGCGRGGAAGDRAAGNAERVPEQGYRELRRPEDYRRRAQVHEARRAF